MDTSNIDEKDMPNVFIGFMTLLQHFDFEEKSHIVNFIFQESVKRLTGNYDY